MQKVKTQCPEINKVLANQSIHEMQDWRGLKLLEDNYLY